MMLIEEKEGVKDKESLYQFAHYSWQSGLALNKPLLLILLVQITI